MKLYQEMDPIERQIMLLDTVCGSALLEGMHEAARECREKALALRAGQNKEEKPLIGKDEEKIN